MAATSDGGTAVGRRLRRPSLFSTLLVGVGFVPAWVATGAIAIVAAFLAPATLSGDSFSSVLPLTTFLGIAALGEMLVIMTGGIDLSIPGTFTLVANLCVGVNAGSNSRLGVTIAILLAYSAVIGLVNGLLIVVARLNPLIVTLATGQILLGISTWYASTIANESSVPSDLSTFATARFLGINAIFWVGLCITLVLALVLRQTTVGRRFQAVGANPRAAWIAGLRVRRYVILAYVCASVLYGAAGLLLAGFIQFPTLDIGGPYLLGPIAAVVIGGASLAGGLASVTSTWVAAFMLTLLSQMLVVLGLSTAWQLVVFGLAIAGGLVVSGDRIVGATGAILQRPGLRPRFGDPELVPHESGEVGGEEGAL
ncbi:MAG: ribose transport system permease protein [Gaiellaceae bacterium]|nr:ribose transport system permease protein [Gaiellaceae bacterium]